jgi:hypothetical protein
MLSMLSKLQADARAFLAAIVAPSPASFLAVAARDFASTPPESEQAPVLHGSPEHFARLFFAQHESFYSDDFRAGFDYMARLLLDRAVKHKPMHPVGSARYDAFQYGCAEATEFIRSADWKRAMAQQAQGAQQ